MKNILSLSFQDGGRDNTASQKGTFNAVSFSTNVTTAKVTENVVCLCAI